ncbi:MAG: hypothetical protein GY950_21995, partial [bacterium]|nr:hypothetical protein [bacterium]
MFTFTGHNRDVGISSAASVSTSGLGDSMLSLRYSPVLFSDGKATEVSFGGGLKFPIGKSNAQLTGVAAEDMQPGTGSWDVVAWGFASKKFYFIRGLVLFTGASLRLNGKNDRGYGFGTEIITALGARLKTKGPLDYSFYARYRWAGRDKRFSGRVPNTGGNWVYLVPSLIFKLSKSMGLKSEVEIPVYRKLTGFRQFTSTFLVSVS